MDKRFIRYSNKQLVSLGHSCVPPHTYVSLDKDSVLSEIDTIKGKFKNVIDLIFNSKNGKLDNDYLNSISENAPEPVKSFIQNVLMSDVAAIPACSDADAALDCIIPRSVGSFSELEPYRDILKGYMDSKLKDNDNSQSSYSSESTD